MRLQSDLGRVRGLGSAKEGTSHWWGQRLTAIALIPLSLWFIYSVVAFGGGDHAAYVAWIKEPGTVLMLTLLLGAMFYHSALGLQVVVEDYVHNESAKLVTIIFINFVSVVLAVASVIAVLKVAFGG